MWGEAQKIPINEPCRKVSAPLASIQSLSCARIRRTIQAPIDVRCPACKHGILVRQTGASGTVGNARASFRWCWHRRVCRQLQHCRVLTYA